MPTVSLKHIKKNLALVESRSYPHPVKVWNRLKPPYYPEISDEEIADFSVDRIVIGKSFRDDENQLFEVKIKTFWGYLEYTVCNGGLGNSEQRFFGLQVLRNEVNRSLFKTEFGTVRPNSPDQNGLAEREIDMVIRAALEEEANMAMGSIRFETPSVEEVQLIEQMRRSGISEEEILTVMHNLAESGKVEQFNKEPAPMQAKPNFVGLRRRPGFVTYHLDSEQFVCACWLPGEKWCFHLEEFFRVGKDVQMARKIEPESHQSYRLPYAKGLLVVETHVTILPTEKAELVMLDPTAMENQTIIAPGESLLDGLNVLMAYYHTLPEAELAMGAATGSGGSICGSRLHRLRPRSFKSDFATIAAQAYTLQHHGVCVECYNDRASTFAADVPEI